MEPEVNILRCSEHKISLAESVKSAWSSTQSLRQFFTFSDFTNCFFNVDTPFAFTISAFTFESFSTRIFKTSTLFAHQKTSWSFDCSLVTKNSFSNFLIASSSNSVVSVFYWVWHFTFFTLKTRFEFHVIFLFSWWRKWKIISEFWRSSSGLSLASGSESW